MKPARGGLLLGVLLFFQAGYSLAPDVPADLMKQIEAVGISQLSVSDASVYHDTRSGCLTITFQAVQTVPLMN